VTIDTGKYLVILEGSGRVTTIMGAKMQLRMVRKPLTRYSEPKRRMFSPQSRKE
jgi:hypothetical protein